MPKATFTPPGIIQFLYQYQAGFVHAADNHLGNPVARMDYLGFVAQVDEDDFYFAAVIAVNRTR